MTTTDYPLSHNPDMRAGETTASFCRRMGYGPGTHLVGDEGYGPMTLVITAVGNRTILGYNLDTPEFETSWSLAHRHWKPTP